MSVTDKGRFCASCQKNVIDFTNLTDTEIINIFKAAKGVQPCGRYQVSQLGRELIEIKKPAFSAVLLKRIAASMLFFQTIVTTAWAQTVKPGTTQHTQNIKGGKRPAHPRTVNGKVMDYATDETLHGMIVQVSGTEIKTVTDKSGSFHLALPDSFTAGKFNLYAHYTDRSSKELRGTIMQVQEVNIEDISAGKDIIMYRYAKDDLALMQVTAHKKVFIDNHMMGGGMGPELELTAPTWSSEAPPKTTKRSFWQKITSPLRKKEKENAQ